MIVIDQAGPPQTFGQAEDAARTGAREELAAKGRRVDQLRALGVSVAESCRRTGISPSSYYRWRARAEAMSGADAAHGGAHDDGGAPLDSAPFFAAGLVDVLAEPMSLTSPSPWSEGAAADRSAPLAASAYWRSAFAEELSDSAIFRHLFGGGRAQSPPAKAPAPISAAWHNRLGAVGLAPVAVAVNTVWAALRRNGLKR